MSTSPKISMNFPPEASMKVRVSSDFHGLSIGDRVGLSMKGRVLAVEKVTKGKGKGRQVVTCIELDGSTLTLWSGELKP